MADLRILEVGGRETLRTSVDLQRKLRIAAAKYG